MSRRALYLLVGFACSLGSGLDLRAEAKAVITDHIILGDQKSEKGHGLKADRSETIPGGLGQPARRLLAPMEDHWEGGSLQFSLKADPVERNYVTIKLWGSDTGRNMLLLFCEGKQIGYRHLGDIDMLDVGSGEAAFKDRFIYNTLPLPLGLTQGKETLQFEIRSIGPIWAYGATLEKYQKPMTEPTRGLYRFYTHKAAFFVPPPDDKQGSGPRTIGTRETPGPEVMDQLKARVSVEVGKLMKSENPIPQMQMQFLARAYDVEWTPAWQNRQALGQLLKSLDAVFVAYRKNPKLAQADPATYNPEWFGLGPSGDVLRIRAQELKPFLDVEIDDGTGTIIRRGAAYAEMLITCRDWHRKHRRLYTNQTMINDLYGIYLANRGVQVVDPAKALPEKEVLRYLYESVALEPWRDSDPGGEAAVETGGKGWNVGADYWQITAKGLTKELGYVGYYGEVLDWATSIYEATRSPSQPNGDEKIRRQLVKMGMARAVFRYPGLDAEGNHAMRIEAVIGWRDSGHYPGDIAYAERVSWDGSALGWVAATLDPNAVGYAQQMFADNQFFATLKKHMEQTGFRVTSGLLPIPDQYKKVRAQANQSKRLPMTPGQPDFVFSDEEDGVVAIKNGDEILYTSLYWRARNAVNFLAKVHYTTPQMDRVAVVRQETEFEPSGFSYTRPDYVNFGFGNGGPKYPGDLHSAHAGEVLPIAKIPSGLSFKPGDESVFAGKGDFYTLHYGDYLIGMNMTKNKTFQLKVPTGAVSAQELVSGKKVKLEEPLKVEPYSTLVLWFGGKQQ